jgi:outer membrane murein-binding lipoprotein Lpp
MTEDNQEMLEPTPEPVLEPSAPESPPEERPSWFRRLGHNLFSAETPTGRTIRAVLIYIGVVVIAFGLGMLVTYLWLYRPLEARLATTSSDLQTVQAELDQTQNQLSGAENEVQTLQAANETLQTRLERSETRIRLLRVMYQARVAQNALQNRDQTAARRALQAARTELDAALPTIESEGDEVAQSLTMRLDLATNDMARDPTTARADLEILINNLILLERLLAQQ